MTARQEIRGYALRLPLDLKRELEAAAAKNQRSLNSEIIVRLRASLEGGYRR